MALSPDVEVLTFLQDPNPEVRKVAMSTIVGYSAQNSPYRRLLVEPLKQPNGQPLQGRDGEPLDVLQRLKSMCRDQPLTAHDAFSALINLSDSVLVSRRIADDAFLEFLVTYIGYNVSLLADLACMLLSNLTKLEPIAGQLLALQVEDRPFYSFLSPQDLQAALSGLDADPSQPDYEERRRTVEVATQRLADSMHAAPQERLPALSKLIRAFEEGAAVATSAASGTDMRSRIAEKESSGEARPVEMDADGRPQVRRRSNCDFLASVFANVTVLPRGREFFVTPFQGMDPKLGDAYPVSRLMIYTEHANLIRRGGVVSALKNILFIKHAHRLLLAPAPAHHCDALVAGAPVVMEREPSPLDVLPYLLLPLIDGKELAKVDLEDQEALPEACQLVSENKPREKDPALRLMLIECLLLLCTSLYGRQSLRTRGVYVVVREAHLAENNEEIAEAVVRLVNILKRDESDASMNETGDGEVDVGAEDNEEEDEDLVIEEL